MNSGMNGMGAVDYQAHGGYGNLKSFQVAQLVYDVTVLFCDRYMIRGPNKRSDGTGGASGVQIAKGSVVSGTSKELREMKLTVARASLRTRLDYEDYLHHRRLPLWAREDPRRAELVALRPAHDDLAQWCVHVARANSLTIAIANNESVPSLTSI